MSVDVQVPMVENNEQQKLPASSTARKTKQLVDRYFPDDEGSDETEETESSFDLKFKSFMNMVIILNGLTLGAMSQKPEFKLGPIDMYLFVDTIFVLAYIAEVLIKWRKTGVKGYFWDGQLEKWNLTDFTLTVMGLIDVAVRVFVQGGSAVEHILEPMSVLRLARLVRVLHLLKDIPALTITIGGVWGSMAPLVWIVLALLFTAYVFAIFFHLMVKNCKEYPDDADCSDSYKNLYTAMLTLIDVVVLIQWTPTIPESQPYLLLPFYIFVLVSAFGIVNVIVGVMVDATSDTRTNLEWATKRKCLVSLGEMWEDEIHSRGLSREALQLLSEEERKVKQTERRSAVRGIIAEIIEQDMVGFPPGTEPEEVRTLLDKNGDGRVSHEDFTLGFGRILLADPLQRSIMSFINQGMIRRHVKEIHERWDELVQNVNDNGRKYDELGGVLGEMNELLEKSQQAVQELKQPKKK